MSGGGGNGGVYSPACMSVVHDCSISTAGSDAGVADVPGPAVEVGVVQEGRLCLVQRLIMVHILRLVPYQKYECKGGRQ